MEIGGDMWLYMMNEGKRIDWRDLGNVQDGGMVEIGFRMRGGGKKKTKTGNQWESLASGGGSERTEESGNDGTEDKRETAVLEETLNGAEEDRELMHEMLETLAVLGPDQRVNMFRWYEEARPKR